MSSSLRWTASLLSRLAFSTSRSVLRGAAEETGPEPAPFLEPAAVDPVSFKVTFAATPVQPILISAGLNCVRGAETPGVPENLETVTPPVSISLTAPADSDSCSLGLRRNAGLRHLRHSEES